MAIKGKLNLSGIKSLGQVVSIPAAANSDRIDLPIAKITVHAQTRTTFSNIAELAADIQINGLMQPLVVHDNADGSYRLIAGERRYRAAILANLSTVPVLIKRGLSALDLHRLQVSENNQRDDLTLLDKMRAVATSVTDFGAQTAAEIWGKSPAWISKHAGIAKYPHELLGLLSDGLLDDVEKANLLSHLAALDMLCFQDQVTLIKQGNPTNRAQLAQIVTAKKNRLAEREAKQQKTQPAAASAAPEPQPTAMVASVSPPTPAPTPAPRPSVHPAAPAPQPAAHPSRPGLGDQRHLLANIHSHLSYASSTLTTMLSAMRSAGTEPTHLHYTQYTVLMQAMGPLLRSLPYPERALAMLQTTLAQSGNNSEQLLLLATLAPHTPPDDWSLVSDPATP